MRKRADFLWLGTSPRHLNTTSLSDSSPRNSWKKSIFLIEHSWHLSSTRSNGVVPFRRQGALSSAPLALESRFQTTQIGSVNISVALVWNFPRSKIGGPYLRGSNVRSSRGP